MRHLAAFLMTIAPVAVFAQAAPAEAVPAPGAALTSFLPIILIFFVFYFLLIRPQQKRMKEHQSLLGGLKRGDEVVTGGGIIGKITKVGDTDQITVKIAEGVEVTVLKSTVVGLASAAKVIAPEKKKAGNKNDNVVPSRDSIANDN